MLEVDERVTGPDGLPKLFSANHRAGFLYQSPQDLKGLLLNPDSDAVLSQLSRLNVEVKGSESIMAHLKPHYASTA